MGAMRGVLRLVVIALVGAGTVLPADALDLQRRRMMTATEQQAWKGVGRLDIRGPYGEGQCTGTLIGEDLVLTAAHCVTSRFTGLTVPAEEVEFTAGERLGVSVGKSKAVGIAVDERYDAGKSSVSDNIPYDLALVRLARKIPKGRAPYFEVAPEPQKDSSLTLISYRGDRNMGLTRQDGCVVDKVEGNVLTLGCEVTYGASGSALFQLVGGETRVVAVLSAMDSRPGKATAYAVEIGTGLDGLREKLK